MFESSGFGWPAFNSPILGERKNMSADIKFIGNIESADRSVGIMAEGFWLAVQDAPVWCDLTYYQTWFEKCVFTWFDNETGQKAERPHYALKVERMLHAMASAFYQEQEEVFKQEEEEDQ